MEQHLQERKETPARVCNYETNNKICIANKLEKRYMSRYRPKEYWEYLLFRRTKVLKRINSLRSEYMGIWHKKTRSIEGNDNAKYQQVYITH